MRDTDLDIAFCERYNLISDEYEGVSVTTLPFSVRVINRFIGNGITTVAELLKTSPSALMKLKGFGKNCLVEVDAFCATLNNDDSIPIVQNKKASLCSSSLFINHRNEIAVGNFSVFEDMDLSETEAEMLQRYREAYDILGEELAFECVTSTENVIPIIEMFVDYQSSIKKHIEIWRMANALPNTRKNNKALGYINTSDLLFFLQSYESANYTYDRQLDVFVLGDDSITGRVQNCIETLPEIVKASQLDSILGDAAEEADIPLEMLEKAFIDAYRLTGEVFHRCRLSLAAIYERVLDTHYPQGFKAYDADELLRFREIIANEYGDVGLPANDRALTARVASICVLCGKGVYRLKKKDYLPCQLANKICEYIENSESTIFLTNTLFSIFEEELLAAGIDNKYFLQGVLHELFADRFVFRRDYISKDVDVSSVYSAVVDFIKKSNFPVSKAQIQEAFPGITEIVINFSVSDPNVLNYFGEYLHASKLNILDNEKTYLFNVINALTSDGEAHHGREIYEIISHQKPEILTRNAAMYPFSAFSVVEFLFRDKFQFSRPYVAKNGVEIGRPAERLHDLIYSSDEFTVSEISEFGRDNHFQIYSLLEYVNGCNDEFLLINDDTMMRIDRTGIDEVVAHQVEDIISDSISETTLVKNLSIWADLPSIKVPWTEWLIYSVIFKWGTKLVAATTSNQFRLSVPLVAPVDNFDPSAFKDVDKGDSSVSFVADDLSDMDSLLEDIIGDDFLDNF